MTFASVYCSPDPKPELRLQSTKDAEVVTQAFTNFNSNLEHLCSLNVRNPIHHARKTGIICTIGPSCRSIEILQQMVSIGMNIARLNFSHGSYEYHAISISNIRTAISKLVDPPCVAIALDTKGPEIRTGSIANNSEIELKSGDLIRIVVNPSYENSCTKENLFVDYPSIITAVSKGSHIFIDDGLISFVVQEISTHALTCIIENGGILGSRKGVNLPGSNVNLPAVSEKDCEDLNFGLKNGVDMIFASFIRNRAGVKEIRNALGEEGKSILIISKIESQQGLDNIDEIIAESDGIMVARGDLGIEIPTEKVFLAQKMIISKCNLVGKPVICATQMLESMTNKPRPTRAESSDVANAVLDGADCVMLSGETAKGEYPLNALLIMHKICKEAESIVCHWKFFEELWKMTPKPTSVSLTTAIGAVSAAISCHASAIIILTSSGKSAYECSRYKLKIPIIAVSRNAQVMRQLNLYHGVFPSYYPNQERNSSWTADVDDRINHGIALGKKFNFIKPGDFVVLITGWREGSGNTNTFRLTKVF